MLTNVTLVVIAAAVIGFLAAAIRIYREYERGVMFTLGRYTGTMGPGLIVMVPIIQQMVRVDLRTRVLNVPEQHLLTNDNVAVSVGAVVYFRVVEAERAVIQVEEFEAATSQLAQTTLRSVLGRNHLDAMLSERARLNAEIQQVLDQRTAAWGIKVSIVEIMQVNLDPTMVRVVARQAEAERNRRAKVIAAQGEVQAARSYLQAGTTLSGSRQAMHLRYLNALSAVAGHRARTLVFPLPPSAVDALANRIAKRLVKTR